jgi:hypothetical protein
MGEVGNSVTKEAATMLGEPETTQLTSLDWTVAFNRSGLHLSNQLRGKRFPSDQLVLFDDSMNRLPVDVQEQARAAGINLIGFDFTVPQQQAFEAALFLINASGRKRQIRIKPQDWIHAYQLRSYEHGDGYQFKSQKQREDAFKALLVLGMKPFLMYYHKLENNREVRETRIAPLWRLGFAHVASVPEAKRIEDVTTDYVSKAEWFELNFDEIWFDQLDNFYIYKPRNLFERIRLSLPGPFEKTPASLHPFLEWVFAEAGRLRNQQKNDLPEHPTYILKADWHEVALQSRLHRQFEKRNYKRAREMLTRNADLAQKAGILDTFRFEGNLFVAAVNPVQFEELEEYLQDRRRKPTKGRSKVKSSETDAPPWDPKKQTPFQVKDLIKEWKSERDRLRSNPIDEKNQRQIAKLTRWIKSFENVLYGRDN